MTHAVFDARLLVLARRDGVSGGDSGVLNDTSCAMCATNSCWDE